MRFQQAISRMERYLKDPDPQEHQLLLEWIQELEQSRPVQPVQEALQVCQQLELLLTQLL